MKRNIDLTENRFFSSSPFRSILSLFKITGEKYPWNIQTLGIKSDDDLDLEHQRNAIIAVGNKATREQIKEYRKMENPNYCDCCGRRMNLKPWDRELGICHKCDSHYKKESEKGKWRDM